MVILQHSDSLSISDPQHPILLNIRLVFFPMLGISCEESHLCKEGAPNLGPKAAFASWWINLTWE